MISGRRTEGVQLAPPPPPAAAAERLRRVRPARGPPPEEVQAGPGGHVRRGHRRQLLARPSLSSETKKNPQLLLSPKNMYQKYIFRFSHRRPFGTPLTLLSPRTPPPSTPRSWLRPPPLPPRPTPRTSQQRSTLSLTCSNWRIRVWNLPNFCRKKKMIN